MNNTQRAEIEAMSGQTGTTGSEAPRKKSRLASTWVKVLGSTAITGLLLFAIFHEQGLAEFKTILTETDRMGVLLYATVSLAALVFRSMRYRLIMLRVGGPENTPPLSSMFVVTAIRNGLVDLLPARLGESAFFYVCNRYGVPLITAASTFSVCLALDIIVLLGLFALLAVESAAFPETGGLFAIGGVHDTKSILLVIGVVCAVLGVLSIALAKLDWFLRLGAKIASAVFSRIKQPKLQALPGLLVAMASELQTLKASRCYTKLVLLTVLLRVAKYGGLYILLIAVISRWGFTAGSISPLLTATAFIGAEASASLPISGIMGFGAYEAAWSLVFSLSKVEIPSIRSVIFAVHIITQVVGYAVALLGLGVFLIREARSKE